jgi:hypothetical protein
MKRPCSPLWQRLRRPVYCMAASAVFGFCPLVPTLIAVAVATLNGCELHEGFPNPCAVCGVEVGGLLYAMGLCFWMAMLTLPLGLLLFAGCTVWFAVEWGRYVLAKRSEKAATGTP